MRYKEKPILSCYSAAVLLLYVNVLIVFPLHKIGYFSSFSLKRMFTPLRKMLLLFSLFKIDSLFETSSVMEICDLGTRLLRWWWRGGVGGGGSPLIPIKNSLFLCCSLSINSIPNIFCH